MTINGWIQIALFGAIVVALAKPFGGFMTRVFAGECTWLTPVLRPLERGFYRLAGVDEAADQHWISYAASGSLARYSCSDIAPTNAGEVNPRNLCIHQSIPGGAQERLEIVKRNEPHRFVVLPKRWIVERTLAWISRCRRLAKDFERHVRKVVAFIRLAMIRLMLR